MSVHQKVISRFEWHRVASPRADLVCFTLWRGLCKKGEYGRDTVDASLCDFVST